MEVSGGSWQFNPGFGTVLINSLGYRGGWIKLPHDAYSGRDVLWSVCCVFRCTCLPAEGRGTKQHTLRTPSSEHGFPECRTCHHTHTHTLGITSTLTRLLPQVRSHAYHHTHTHTSVTTNTLTHLSPHAHSHTLKQGRDEAITVLVPWEKLRRSQRDHRCMPACKSTLSRKQWWYATLQEIYAHTCQVCHCIHFLPCKHQSE